MEWNIDFKFVSADSHVLEPRDLWTKRMDARFRDRAPHVESLEDGDYYVVDGIPPWAVGLEGPALSEKITEGRVRRTRFRYEEARPGGWDPAARLADQDADNVRAEIVYPCSMTLRSYNTPDPEYAREMMRCYNDWVAEFCAAAPDRLVGVAVIPIAGPIEWTVAEIERVARLGFRTVHLPSEIPGKRYASDYEPMWAALQDHDMPAAFHAGANAGFSLPHYRSEFGLGGIIGRGRLPGTTVGELIWGGVCQRHPRIKIVFCETGFSWIGSLLPFMDHMWTDNGTWAAPDLPERPSFYFFRNFWMGFDDDPAGIHARHFYNMDHLMWGSDYPHTEGCFPKSKQRLAADMANVPRDEAKRIVADNAARLYGLPR